MLPALSARPALPAHAFLACGKGDKMRGFLSNPTLFAEHDAMPIYEYHCSSCGFQKDHLQKLRDEPLTTCPACGKETYAKALTAAGFQLKGTGWYATDFKGGNTASAPAKNDPPAPAANAGGCCANCACHGA